MCISMHTCARVIITHWSAMHSCRGAHHELFEGHHGNCCRSRIQKSLPRQTILYVSSARALANMDITCILLVLANLVNKLVHRTRLNQQKDVQVTKKASIAHQPRLCP